MKRQLVAVLQVQKEQLPAAAVVFVEPVQRLKTPQAELFSRRKRRVRISERELRTEHVAVPQRKVRLVARADLSVPHVAPEIFHGGFLGEMVAGTSGRGPATV